MTLAAGTRLGPYEIVGPLGAGGMGEVFRARDTRLGREVAVKVLPGGLADDADRLRRFEQEARSASALNHPHILVVHDFGQQEGTPFLVTELLEGQTLRERLSAGPIPPRKAIEIASQIARGLAAAHERGIVHRDLKPENLFVTSDGVVKILDFGLAKLLRPEMSGTQLAGAPTVGGTEPGVVLGTAGYMAPEQVRGLPADHRSDLFSFGAILYEMLSGKKPFERDSAADTMAAILREDPPELAPSGVSIPPALERIVHHCLEKDPAARPQSARDLTFELELVSSMGTGAAAALAAPVTRRGRLLARGSWLLAGLLLGGLIGAGLMSGPLQPKAAGPATTRFQISPPPGTGFNPEDWPVAVSPDGRRLAFGLSGATEAQLWVQGLDQLEPRAVFGAERGYEVFWSPDGRYLGFFYSGQLMKIDLSGGGPPQPIAPVSDGRGATWSPSGVIVYAPESAGALLRVPAAGGEPQPATRLDGNQGIVRHLRPHFLPDGRHFLFLQQARDAQESALMVGSLDSFETKRILALDVPARYAEPGYLLYLRESTLVAHPFDLERLEAHGEPVSVAAGVTYVGRYESPSFSAAANVLAYHPAGGPADLQPIWFGRSGEQLGPAGAPGDANLDLSPDGRWVAAMNVDRARRVIDVWLIDLERGVRSRFTFEREAEIGPVWSADGRQVFYSVYRAGAMELVVKPAGGGTPRMLLQRPHNLEAVAASPDGRSLLVETNPPGRRTDLELVDLASPSPDTTPFAATEFDEHSGRFSGDGKFVAYASDESGRDEIYVQPVPPTGAKWQISNGGGDAPRWRRDGRELFYYSPDQQIMAVDLHTESGFQAGIPKPLLPAGSSDYVVAPDGSRFLIPTRSGSEAPEPLVVVLDWTAGLPAPRK